MYCDFCGEQIAGSGTRLAVILRDEAGREHLTMWKVSCGPSCAQGAIALLDASAVVSRHAMHRMLSQALHRAESRIAELEGRPRPCLSS